MQAPAERMIRDCVACELAYINTDHPAFIGGNRAIAAVLGGQVISRFPSTQFSPSPWFIRLIDQCRFKYGIYLKFIPGNLFKYLFIERRQRRRRERGAWRRWRGATRGRRAPQFPPPPPPALGRRPTVRVCRHAMPHLRCVTTQVLLCSPLFYCGHLRDPVEC